MRNGAPKKKVYIDEGLFAKIQQGDRDAFQELYQITYKPVYAFLLSYAKNAEDAKDLMQDTYVQVFQHAGKYQSQGNPMAWILKIAKNNFLMKYRKDVRTQTVEYDTLEHELGFDHIVDVDNRMILEKMFSILSAEERAIIVMHDIDGLKFKEIAAVAEMPIGTVLTKYNRSMKKLQKQFGERCGA